MQLLEETQHFCGCGQEKVAKVVQCGEQLFHSSRPGGHREVASSFWGNLR